MADGARGETRKIPAAGRGLASYAAYRLLGAVPMLFGAATIVFLILHLAPGGPARARLGEKASPQAIANLERRMGWDKPLPVQYVRFLQGIVTGLDFGPSVLTGEPVRRDIARVLPATIELSFSAMLIATVAGVLCGIGASLAPRGPFDRVVMAGSLVGVSVPIFFLGLVLIMAAPFLPGGGREPLAYDLPETTGFYVLDAILARRPDMLWDVLRHLILPAITLSTIPAAIITRMTRTSMLEVLGSDYIRTARAKGLPASRVVLRHALANALIPIVTVVGLNFGYLLAGAVLTETVFSWPGIGRYVVDAVLAKDYNAVQGGVVTIASIFVIMNLLVDMLYGFIDPRISVRGSR